MMLLQKNIQQRVTILDDDPGEIPKIFLKPSRLNVSAGETARVQIEVVGDLFQTVKVPYQTILGSASLDDFEYKNGTFTFQAGISSQVREVSINTSENISQNEVNFFLRLLPPTNSILVEDSVLISISR